MLITLEGLPGSGKTTQADLLTRCLRRHGHPVMTLPDLATLDTPPASSTLVDLLAAQHDPFLRTGDPVTDTMLTAAIRADLVATLIDPALLTAPDTTTPDKVVIEDRGVHTMASYALASLLSHHHAPTSRALAWLNALIVLAGPRPGPAIWLRLDPDTAARRAARRPSASPHTPEQQVYLRWVHHAYKVLADHDPHLVVLDVTGHAPARIHRRIHHLLGRYNPTLPGCPATPSTTPGQPSA